MSDLAVKGADTEASHGHHYNLLKVFFCSSVYIACVVWENPNDWAPNETWRRTTPRATGAKKGRTPAIAAAHARVQNTGVSAAGPGCCKESKGHIPGNTTMFPQSLPWKRFIRQILEPHPIPGHAFYHLYLIFNDLTYELWTLSEFCVSPCFLSMGAQNLCCMHVCFGLNTICPFRHLFGEIRAMIRSLRSDNSLIR